MSTESEAEHYTCHHDGSGCQWEGCPFWTTGDPIREMCFLMKPEPEPREVTVTRGALTDEEAQAVLTLVKGGWLKLELALDRDDAT